MAEMDDDLREKLKSALWFSVGKIVDEETLRMGVNSTPQFIGALTELVWAQLESISHDLPTFAAHAGRSTINTDDVLLITRRNDALHGLIKDFVDAEKAKESSSGSRGGKGGAVRGKSGGGGGGGAKSKGKGRTG